MRIRDDKGFIGLFYIIDQKLYAGIEDIEECIYDVDSNGEVQPQKFTVHEQLLAALPRYGVYLNGDENYSTYPRGRVYYNVKDHCFVIATAKPIYEKYGNDIKQEFNLTNKKVKVSYQYEYEYFDEDNL